MEIAGREMCDWMELGEEGSVDGREIKLIPCTIPDLFVFYADQVVIKVWRLLTKEGAVFVQQSHLNAMKWWDWKNCYVRDTQLLRNWRFRSDMNLCWLAKKHSSYATLVYTSVVRRKWGISLLLEWDLVGQPGDVQNMVISLLPAGHPPCSDATPCSLFLSPLLPWGSSDAFSISR